MSELSSTVARIRSGIATGAYTNEAAVRNQIVVPILRVLGWDDEDPYQVRHEYPLRFKDSTRHVDLALCIAANKPRCILELKSTRVDLDQGDVSDADLQLFEYAYYAGPAIALLTNGKIWKFYSILTPGSYHERMVGQWSIETESADLIWALERYLSYRNTVAGQAAEDIRTDLDSKNRQRLARKAIPRAWQTLLQEPDCEVVRLLVRATESSAGSPPTEKDVLKFLIGLELSETKTTAIDPPPPKPPRSGPPKPVTKQGIRYSFLRNEHTAKTAIEAYEQIFERLGQRDSKFYERAAERLMGRKRNQLARTVKDLGLGPSPDGKFRKLSSGWLLISHLSNSDKEKYLRVACEVAGIPFNDPTGLKISLPTTKRVRRVRSTITSSGEAS